MADTYIQILCAPNVTLSSDVAAAVLTACEASVVRENDRWIAPSLRFAGASAISCARTHPARAEVIATRTDDLGVQRALLDLSRTEGFQSVLKCLARAELVSDKAVLQEVHDRIHENGHEKAPTSLIERVDALHMLEYLEKHPAAYGGNLPTVAERIAALTVASRDASYARRFINVCDRTLHSSDGKYSYDMYVLMAIEHVASTMVASAASDLLEDVIADSSFRTASIFAHDAWDAIDVIDVDVATLTLRHVDAEEFQERQRSEKEHRASRIVQYPQSLAKKNIQCTDDAWRVIATAWPGILYEPLRNLVNSDPQRELLVELALESGRSDLASTLVDRLYHAEGGRSGPLVNAAQYAIASMNLHHGERHVHPGTKLPTILGPVAVSHIPADTSVVDVLRIWADHAVSDIVATLCNAQQATWHEWLPTMEEFNELLHRCDQHATKNALREGLHSYALDEHRPPATDFSRARPYLDAISSRVSASDVLEEHGGSAYVVTRLNEAFGADIDGWLYAWHLAVRGTVPIDAVISAAQKLT